MHVGGGEEGRHTCISIGNGNKMNFTGGLGPCAEGNVDPVGRGRKERVERGTSRRES